MTFNVGGKRTRYDEDIGSSTNPTQRSQGSSIASMLNDVISGQVREKFESSTQQPVNESGTQYGYSQYTIPTPTPYQSQRSGNFNTQFSSQYKSQGQGKYNNYNKNNNNNKSNISNIPKVLLPAELGNTTIELNPLTNDIGNLNELITSESLISVQNRRYITTFKGGVFNIIPSAVIPEWKTYMSKYPYYKVTYIQFQFTPRINAVNVDTGTFLTSVDHTAQITDNIETTPHNYSRILNSKRKREHPTFIGKSSKRSFKPSILERKVILKSNQGTNNDNYTAIDIPLYGQYLQTSKDGDVPYLGLRWGWKTDRELTIVTDQSGRIETASLAGEPYTQKMDVKVVILYAFKYFI